MDFREALTRKVTVVMNVDLTTEFQADEVKAALFQMDPMKAPSPNGMSPIFFQKYWHVVGDSVISAVLQALSSGKAGAAAVLRDHSSRVLIAASKAELEMDGLEALELMAIFRGIQLCATMGIPKLIVESDSLLCVEALHNSRMHNSLLGGLYYEIKQLSSCFECC
ncbi:uncharacterized protein LOC122309995 isoform X1 [Carya illinoinensis]|uniref:uncharacterized protein LOC122309995 isoform X1 n=1 Tax=Carya illinoinensis TaxID=32201 RepID=UPI001C720C86|nr:uncharacterized protein LOC122309995 isoform X1 [Carya illinoinensis]